MAGRQAGGAVEAHAARPAAWCAAAVLALAAGVALRLVAARGQVLGGDELHAVRAVLSLPPSRILTSYQGNDHCIPLSFLYALLSRHAALSEAALRAPLVLAGVGLLVAVPRLLRRELGGAGAALLAWLLALSPMLVMYSTIARPYMAVALLGFAAAWAFLSFLERPSWGRGAAYVACAALAAWFHLSATPLVVAPFLYAVSARWIAPARSAASTRSLLLLGAGLLLGLALLIGPAAATLPRLLELKRAESGAGAATLAGVASLLSGSASLPLTAAFFALAALGLARWLVRRRRLALFSLTLVAVQLASVAWGAPAKSDRPHVFARYVLIALPWLLAWVAAGLSTPWWPHRSAAARLAQGAVAFAFPLALFVAGPLADRGFWSSSFRPHVDFVAFDEPRATVSEADVPAVYRRAAGEPGPVLEYPWPTIWKLGRVFYAYQAVHGQEVLVATPDPLLADARLALGALVRPSPDDVLASRARYVVVHRDLEAETARLAGARRDWDADAAPALAELRQAARAMAGALEARLGPPHHADAFVSAWDLDAARGGARRAAATPPAPPERRPSVLLVSVDTLRADHLGSYGYPRGTSPVLDALARRSLRFADVHAPTPWTLPSHAAMLAGRDPLALGILDKSGRLPEGTATLAEPLRAHGYQTAAFVDSGRNGFVGAARGFGRGFDLYAHAPHGGDGALYDMRRTVDAAVRWLERADPARPFFLFLHTKSVHSRPRHGPGNADLPYDKPEPYLARFLEGRRPRFAWGEGALRGVGYLRELNRRLALGTLAPGAFDRERIAELVALYDAGIYYVDEQIGRLLAALDELGLEDDTIVAVVSDHGEAFLDHRFFLHQELYHPLVHVPLILRVPGRAGAVVPGTARLEQLPATLLGLVGIAPPAGMAAASLLDEATRADPAPRFSYFRLDPSYAYVAYGVEEGPWLLVYHKTDAEPAFRTELVPHEGAPPSPAPSEEERSALEAALRARLLEHFESVVERPLTEGGLDEETARELRALGYVE